MRFEDYIPASFSLATRLAFILAAVHVTSALSLRAGGIVYQYESISYLVLESILMVIFSVWFLRRNTLYRVVHPFFTALFFYFIYAMLTRVFYAIIMLVDIFSLNKNFISHLLNAFAPSLEGGTFGIISAILTGFILPSLLFFVISYRAKFLPKKTTSDDEAAIL